MKFLVINGVNLNLLGEREPDIYGTGSLEDLEKMLSLYAEENGFELETRQSNI